MQHDIDAIEGSKPVSKPPYWLSANEAKEVERQLADYLTRAFIRPHLGHHQFYWLRRRIVLCACSLYRAC